MIDLVLVSHSTEPVEGTRDLAMQILVGSLSGRDHGAR